MLLHIDKIINQDGEQTLIVHLELGHSPPKRFTCQVLDPSLNTVELMDIFNTFANEQTEKAMQSMNRQRVELAEEEVVMGNDPIVGLHEGYDNGITTWESAIQKSWDLGNFMEVRNLACRGLAAKQKALEEQDEIINALKRRIRRYVTG